MDRQELAIRLTELFGNEIHPEDLVCFAELVCARIGADPCPDDITTAVIQVAKATQAFAFEYCGSERTKTGFQNEVFTELLSK